MNMSKYIKETNIKEECFQMYQQSNKYHKCMHAYIDVKIYQRNNFTYECLQMHQKIQIILQYIFLPPVQSVTAVAQLWIQKFKSFSTTRVSPPASKKNMTHLCQKPTLEQCFCIKDGI